MVDAVNNNSPTVQRAQVSATQNLRNNQKIAQALFDQIQGGTNQVKNKNLTAQSTKLPGVSGNLPRGSLVDITV